MSNSSETSTASFDYNSGHRHTPQPWLEKQLDMLIREPYNTVRIPGGWCATVFHIVSKHKHFMVKTSLEGEDHEWSVGNLQREATKYAALAPATRRTPQLLQQLHPPESDSNADLALMFTWIPGVPSARLLNQHVTTAPEFTHICDTALSTLNEPLWEGDIHTLPQWIPGSGTFDDLLYSEEAIAYRRTLGTHAASLILDAAKHNQHGVHLNENSEKLVVVHGDFHPGNILADTPLHPNFHTQTQAFSGIIDWDKAGVGSRSVDITRLWLSVGMWEDETWERQAAQHIYDRWVDTPQFRWDVAATVLAEMGSCDMYVRWVEQEIGERNTAGMLRRWLDLTMTVVEHLR